jgi:diaminohydroxyphosphoribosylaminopyrimidine deaminase/5-amino-6-(5-phosphoribosylamino)uracil reductase
VRERLGARVLPIRRAGSHLDLRHAVRRLAAEGLTSVLVEGGAGLAAALLRADLVDEIHWFVAPMLVGGDGRAALGPLALKHLADATRLDEATLRRRDGDIHLHAFLTPWDRAARRSR